MRDTHITLIELPPFKKGSRKILTRAEISELKDYIKLYPKKGNVIAGTGGIRKLRWASSGKGKRGGARIIYFYHVVGTRIYLMAIYTKNDQADISPKVKKQLKAIVDIIKEGGR